jgi:hypothetical protein
VTDAKQLRDQQETEVNAGETLPGTFDRIGERNDIQITSSTQIREGNSPGNPGNGASVYAKHDRFWSSSITAWPYTSSPHFSRSFGVSRSAVISANFNDCGERTFNNLRTDFGCWKHHEKSFSRAWCPAC